MAVEGKARFEPQGIPRPQPHRRRTLLRKKVPEPGGIGCREEELKTEGLARVPGSGDEDLLPGDGDRSEGVLEGLRERARTDQPLEDGPGGGPLERDHRHPLRNVFQLGPGKAGTHILQIPPVRCPVGGVDHEEVLARGKPVEIGVVQGAAPVVGDHRVLRETGIEGRGIVGQEMLEEGQGAGAADGESAHVGDIEKPRPLPRGQMLLHDPLPILEGHVPAAEVDHRRPEGDVVFVQDRLEQLPHDLPLYIISLILYSPPC